MEKFLEALQELVPDGFKVTEFNTVADIADYRGEEIEATISLLCDEFTIHPWEYGLEEIPANMLVLDLFDISKFADSNGDDEDDWR